MKELVEKWFIYAIDGEGRLKQPYKDYPHYSAGHIFSEYGYDTEQEAKDDLMQKAYYNEWQHETYVIVKGYQIKREW